MIRTSYLKYKPILLLFLLMIIIGIFCGMLYCFKLEESFNDVVFEQVLSLLDKKMLLNANFYHIIIVLLISLTSFILIGPFFSVFALFYEGFSAGVIVMMLIREKALKGLIFAIIYIIGSKSFFLILLIVLSVLSFKLFKNIISKNNKNNNYYLNLYSYLKHFIIILSFMTLNEFFLVPLLSKLCCYFSFLIV